MKLGSKEFRLYFNFKCKNTTDDSLCFKIAMSDLHRDLHMSLKSLDLSLFRHESTFLNLGLQGSGPINSKIDPEQI